MWVMITGATGSGKRVIADYLIKDGFELIDPSFDVEVGDDNFSKELTYLMKRLNAQLRAASLKDRRNVVTLRSFFDTYEVMIKTAHLFTHITDKELAHLKIIYDNLITCDQAIAPPDALVYMDTPKMAAMNRQALTGGREVTQEFFHKEVEAYRAFVDRVAVPTINISASSKPEVMKNELDYGVNSLKAANLGSQSVWTRSFFR